MSLSVENGAVLKAHLPATVTCFLISWGGFLFGWDTGTISGITVMPDFLKRFGRFHESTGAYTLSVYKTGVIVSMFSVGAAIGGLTLGKLADVFGRRKGLVITLGVYLMGVILQIASTDTFAWVQFFIGRIITGACVGSTLVIGPMYISEISPKEIRGITVSLFQIQVTFGIFIGYCVCYGSYHHYEDSRQWRVPVGLSFMWSLICMAGVLCVSESPRYLLQKGRVSDAEKSLCKINKVNSDSPLVKRELAYLVEALENEMTTQSSWKTLLSGKPRIRYRVAMGTILDGLQQLTGNTYFFYYGTAIFRSVGLNDSFMTSIILGVDNFVSTFVALYILDHLGRRKTLLYGSAGMLVCLIVYSTLGLYLYPGEYGVNAHKPIGDAMIVFCCLYIFSYATTWGPGIFVILGESFPISIRSQAIAIATTGNWLCGFLIAFFTPTITATIHFAYGYVFVGCETFALIFVFLGVPETKGLDLEAVDSVYETFVPGLAFKNI